MDDVDVRKKRLRSSLSCETKGKRKTSASRMQRRGRHPERTIFNAKRYMGRDLGEARSFAL